MKIYFNFAHNFPKRAITNAVISFFFNDPGYISYKVIFYLFICKKCDALEKCTSSTSIAAKNLGVAALKKTSLEKTQYFECVSR